MSRWEACTFGRIAFGRMRQTQVLSAAKTCTSMFWTKQVAVVVGAVDWTVTFAFNAGAKLAGEIQIVIDFVRRMCAADAYGNIAGTSGNILTPIVPKIVMRGALVVGFPFHINWSETVNVANLAFPDGAIMFLVDAFFTQPLTCVPVCAANVLSGQTRTTGLQR